MNSKGLSAERSKMKKVILITWFLTTGGLILWWTSLVKQLSSVTSFGVIFGREILSTGSEDLLRSHIVPLVVLTDSYKEIQCPSSLKAVKDTLLDPSLAFADGRKIPRIVHVTSMSRCNHPLIADNLETWKLKNHSFFLHDDEAMEKLIYKDWPEFPQLQRILKCLPGRGAVWADVWRILVLWEYGGIYADIDTSPVAEFFNETTLSPRHDAFFVVEVNGGPSQWFMAASPRHPIMYFSMHHLMKNVMRQMNLGGFRVVFTTGPGAINDGLVEFTRNSSMDWKAREGHYVGVGNHTVTIVGNSKNENMYITRVIESLKHNKVKHSVFQESNMTHLTEMENTIYQPNKAIDESCLGRLYSMEKTKDYIWRPEW